MSEARDRILARLREGRGPSISAAVPESPRPTAPIPDAEGMVRRFTERLEAVRAEVHRTSGNSWTATLWRLCSEKGIGNLLYGPHGPLAPALSEGTPDSLELVPCTEPVEAWKERLFFATDGAVTSAHGGIAETGSLILWPTAAEPRLISLVPPVHFVVLDIARLYPTFADAMREQRWSEGLPTNALLISGPSKSADIEQTLAYGVHGPKEFIVLLNES